MASVPMRVLSVWLRVCMKPRVATAERARARMAKPKDNPEPPASLRRRHQVSVRTVGGFPCYTVTPRSVTTPARALVYLHGGAYVSEITRAHWRFISRLAFQYPADDRAKWATFEAQQDAATRDAEAVAEQKRAQEQAKDKQAGVLPMVENALDNLYFDYKLSGDPAYRPERVLDDGQHTYLIYPNDGRFRELPTLLMLVNGKTELVNFRVDGTRYIVDRLFDKAILVVGVGKKQTRVTITRATPYSGATGKRS